MLGRVPRRVIVKITDVATFTQTPPPPCLPKLTPILTSNLTCVVKSLSILMLVFDKFDLKFVFFIFSFLFKKGFDKHYINYQHCIFFSNIKKEKKLQSDKQLFKRKNLIGCKTIFYTKKPVD
jgi:hypothetical protein